MRRGLRSAASGVLIGSALFVAGVSTAHAGDAWDFSVLAEGDFALVGLSGGPLVGLGDESSEYWAIGLEASWVRWHGWPWWGFVGDVRWDTAADGVGLGFGPEVGFGPFGVDALLFARVGATSSIGVRPRGCLSFGGPFVSFSGCVGVQLTTAENLLEGTLSIKYVWRLRSSEIVSE